MTSSKPYLLRALYEWIADNDCTPHLLVDAEWPDVQVPQDYVNEGQIVLNVASSAVRQLHMDNEAVQFEGRFGGISHDLYLPMAAIVAIYARENGQGMVFEPTDTPPPEDDSPQPPERPSGRPSLKVVK